MSVAIKKLPDQSARFTALTALDRSLLVEAGAGSGKTAIMAGRVAILLAQGIEPKRIAAITFTEFAASELLIRIDRFVERLARGDIPADVAIAFPKGVSSKQKENLERARKLIDQIVCSTIHGFAQALIKPYPVEAGIDPGAEIVDPAEADLAFEERYDAWLRAHLSGEAQDDLIAELVLADQGGALNTIREVADFRRRNRDARPAETIWKSNTLDSVAKAVRKFQGMLKRLDFQETDTADRASDLAEYASALSDPALLNEQPANRALIQAMVAERPKSCFTQVGSPRALQTKGKWEKAAAAAGQSKAEGAKLHEEAKAHYEACHAACEAALMMLAGTLLERLSVAMDGLLTEWRSYKNAAALLDFDDLLYTARDLLKNHEDVRNALAVRYKYVLVDEFQDTDPLQIDILWRLSGEPKKGAKNSPLDRKLRAGALFLVGDPKQAIYRLRGADVNAYVAARSAVGDDALLAITANFRSVEPILSFVNAHFKAPLSEENGQPGFTELSPTCEAFKDSISVVALHISDGDTATANVMRDAEAERVADLCSRLVGNRLVRDNDAYGKVVMRPCRLGDIALLAPTGTELWRFEKALEDRGLTVSTQAGKGFFHRQEIKDLIALTRTLADGRDTLALGSLLRGPLIGLTEVDLLNVAEALPVDLEHPGRLPQLNLWTDPECIADEAVRDVMRSLQSLARRARSTTPHALLSDAIGLLHIRSKLPQRFKTNADRALANVDLYLEISRDYAIRGIRAFARDMLTNWEEAVRQVEGRPDAEEQSIALITIHSSKGLEWPIVVPINMTGAPKTESGLMHERRSERFSLPMFGAEPEDYAEIKDWNIAELARERVRLWYVAATRARDLLVLPRHSCALREGAFARIVDFDLPSLGAIDPESLGEAMRVAAAQVENQQTRDSFSNEANNLLALHHRITWRQPSRNETAPAEAEPPTMAVAPTSLEKTADAQDRQIVGGTTRGIILHKLMEEVLNRETEGNLEALLPRATELLKQLSLPILNEAKDGISPREIAQTILRTLDIPVVARLRPRLVPEYTVQNNQLIDNREIIVSGIADAVAYDSDGRIEVVIDWKSDTEVTAQRMRSYLAQLESYRTETNAKYALLVMMTTGNVFGDIK